MTTASQRRPAFHQRGHIIPKVHIKGDNSFAFDVVAMRGPYLALAVCGLALLYGAHADVCLKEAHHARDADDMQHWTRGSRQLPNISDHALGYGDWEGILTRAPTAEEISCMAGRKLYLMFKVVNRTVYQLQVPHDIPY